MPPLQAGPCRHSLRIAAGGVAVACLAAVPARAQSSGDGFLFRRPYVSFTLRGGFNRASAGSDIFAFTTTRLTLDRGDFGSATFGGEVGVVLAPRFDLALAYSVARKTSSSEFRDWVDQSNLPIEQVTTFNRTALTAGLKAYLLPRGRAVGSLAWLPARAVPFVGAGGGMMSYRFEQVGDFIDFSTSKVFHDDFTAEGQTTTLYGLAGVDFSLTATFVLTAEARYNWARGPMGQDFVGFHRIDLSGVAVTTGVSARF
jgi:hypothetical protein